MAFLKKGGKGTVQHKPRLHHKFNEQCMVIAYHCLKVSLFWGLIVCNFFHKIRPCKTVATRKF